MKIDAILNRYFEGETSLEEEKALKAYFASGEVDEDHQIYTDLFACFKEEAQITYNEDNRIDFLLEHYFEGETTIKQEQELKAYFNQSEIVERHKQYASLFNYYAIAQTEVLEKAIDLKEAKTLHIFRRSMMGIAAGLALLLCSLVVMNSLGDYRQNQELAQAIEQAEAEEALETTMEALAFLGFQFNKGTESLQQLKNLQRADILKN